MQFSFFFSLLHLSTSIRVDEDAGIDHVEIETRLQEGGVASPGLVAGARGKDGQPGEGLDRYLESLKGQTKVDCTKVCHSVGAAYNGFGESMTGASTEYKCVCGEAPVVVICKGHPFTQCCNGDCISEESKALPDNGVSLAPVLDGFQGLEKIDCGQVCGAYAKPSNGQDMTTSGQLTSYHCLCGDATVLISCIGSPFVKCCKDQCDRSSDCADVAQGWSCPANDGCKGAQCAGDDWRAWVSAHNLFRCMHDVPPVVWSNEMYEDSKNFFSGKSDPVLDHSESYELPVPVGPAGENLFRAKPGLYNSMDTVAQWYAEIRDCGGFPGCKEGKHGAVGQFTAMIWQGNREIACFINPNGLVGCRYRGTDVLDCNTANYGDKSDYAKNVYRRSKGFEFCQAELARCGLDEAKPKTWIPLDSILGLPNVTQKPKESGQL